MNKFIYILIAAASLLGGCGMIDDIAVDGRAYLHRCSDPTFKGDPEVNHEVCPRDIRLQFREESAEGPDHWVGLMVTKLGAGNNVCIYGALDPKFEFTIMGNNNGTCVSGANQWISFGSYVVAGTDIYFKACYDTPENFDPFNWSQNFFYCTPVHRYHLHNDEREDPDYWGDSYRRFETEVEGVTLSCTNETIAGVIACYAWEYQQFMLKNQSNTTVHFSMEIEARSSVVADQWYMDPGDIDIVDAKDVKVNDVISVKAWVGVFEANADVLLGHEPDDKAHFTMSQDKILTVVREASSQTAVAAVPQLQGIDCQIIRKIRTDATTGNQMATGDTISCSNNGADNVEVQIWQLKPNNPATDGTYIRDFKLTEFNLDGKVSQETPTANSTLTLALDTSKHYLLDVRTTGWWDNPHLRSVQPFTINGSGITWQVTLLPLDSYYESEPAQ